MFVPLIHPFAAPLDPDFAGATRVLGFRQTAFDYEHYLILLLHRPTPPVLFVRIILLRRCLYIQDETQPRVDPEKQTRDYQEYEYVQTVSRTHPDSLHPNTNPLF